jgi:hypothetical protein
MATLKRPLIGIIFIVFILVIIILLLRTNSSSFGSDSSGYIVNIGTERMDVFYEPAVNPSSPQNLTGQQQIIIKLYNDRNEQYWYYLYGSSTAYAISKDKSKPSTITLNGGGGRANSGSTGAYLYIFKNTKRQQDTNNESLLIYVDGFQNFAIRNDSWYVSRGRSVGLIPDGTVYTYGVSTVYGKITLYKSLVTQGDNFYKNAMFQAYNIPRRGNEKPYLANYLYKEGSRTANNYDYNSSDDASNNSIAFTGGYLRIVNSTDQQRNTINYLYY